MRIPRNHRLGAGTTEYILILALVLGLALLLFGRSFLDLVNSQIDKISNGVAPGRV
jgi:hypothetical protein